MTQLPLHVGLPELALVALATLIIGGILGPRYMRDLRQNKSRRDGEGTPGADAP